ncbi:MAG: MBL fold metallo-hydrolase [Vampirovibrionales bacterium]|nr:MBL fold metallo-hydrolase [Vampirovibrionales bacterium]
MENASPWQVETFAVGPLQCNCALVSHSQKREAILFDPGGDEEALLAHLQAKKLRLVGIFHTHAHFDHICGSGAMHHATGAPLALHEGDRPLWDHVDMQCAQFPMLHLKPPALPEPQRALANGDALPFDGRCLHTPGHSPGSCCFYFEAMGLLISGDTLFHRSVGRTDLWGGDSQALEQSIQQTLYALPDVTRVITGHGPQTVLGDEKRLNPFIAGDAL